MRITTEHICSKFLTSHGSVKPGKRKAGDLGRGFSRATEVCESAGAGDDEVEQGDE